MVTEFGTDHVYNCDVFNEMRPASSDPLYVSSVGAAVFKAMKLADPNALWFSLLFLRALVVVSLTYGFNRLMQGWLFKNDQSYWTADLAKAFLTSVPQVRF